MTNWFYGLIDAVKREWVLALIILGFLFIAGTGLFYNFGLPIAVPGEVTPLPAALKMIADHTLRPAYPTFIYLPIAAFAMLPFVLLGVLTLPFFGVTASVDAIREFGILHYAQLLPWIRLASVFYGALAIYLLYLIARRVLERRETALLAAFFLATSLLFVELAHFGKVWIVQLLTIIFTLWATLKLFDKPTRRRYVFAAVGIALSFGVNVVGGLVYVPFVVAHALRHRGVPLVRRFFMHRDFLLAHALLFGSALLFYYLNPYGYANYLSYIKSFFSLATTSSGLDQIISGQNTAYCDSLGIMTALTYYPHILVEYELPIVLFALLGLVFFRRKIMEKRNEAIILGSFALAYFIGITAITVLGINPCQARYILPVVPILALLSALLVTSAREVVGKRLSATILFLALLTALYGPLMFDARLMLPSTRMMAREWIFANIPDGARVVMLDETLDLPENEATLRDIETYAPYFMTKKREYLLNSLKEYSGVRYWKDGENAPQFAAGTDRRQLSSVPDGDSSSRKNAMAVAPHGGATRFYYIFTPTYFRGDIPAELMGERYDYIIVSWWNPTDRREQLALIEKSGILDTMERIMRFPDTATDETESMDLAGETRDPLFTLPLLRQNGPVIDVYRLQQD